ncbi:MAG TPA: hypothetical protein PK990_06295 [Salinivirgaceae bacterium]|nr:hypothetical protein [Salinivirgaceae bacterium]
MQTRKLIFKSLQISLGGFVAIGWLWYQHSRRKVVRTIVFPLAIAFSFMPWFISTKINTIYFLLWLFIFLVFLSNQTLLHFSKHETPALKIPWEISISGFLLIAFSFVAPSFFFTNYGFTSSIPVAQNKKLYYNQTIQPNEAKLIANFLKNVIDSTDPEIRYYRLHKSDSNFEINLVAENSTRNNDIFYLEMLQHTELKLNNQDYLDKPIRLFLTDAISGKNRSLSHQFLPADSLKLELLSLIPYQMTPNQIIYHNVAVTSGDLTILTQTLRRLKNYFPEHHKYDILFQRYRSRYVLKFFVPEQFWSNRTHIERYIEIGQYLEKSGLFQPVRIELIDRSGKRFRVPVRL